MAMSNDELQQVLFATFADEARERLQTIFERSLALETAEGHAAKQTLLEDILREIHSLKGDSRAVDLDQVAAAAHRLEGLYSVIHSGRLNPDAAMLELAQAALGSLAALVEEGLSGRPSGVDAGRLCSALGAAAEGRLPGERSWTTPLVTGALEERVATVRSPDGVRRNGMATVSTIFDSFPSLVRQLARELAKEVELKIEGGDVEVERPVLDQLRSPLTHMIRNCVDHGAEAPATRQTAGKRRRGTVIARARRHAAELVIEVTDDGAGIHVEKVKAMAVEKGLVGARAAAAMSEREALWLIFRSGVSTRREITEVSGRGIGLDVVRERVERLHGTIDVQSSLGEGTKFTLTVPAPRTAASNSRPQG